MKVNLLFLFFVQTYKINNTYLIVRLIYLTISILINPILFNLYFLSSMFSSPGGKTCLIQIFNSSILLMSNPFLKFKKFLLVSSKFSKVGVLWPNILRSKLKLGTSALRPAKKRMFSSSSYLIR